MALYFIGDVQGCDDALGRLLAAVDFSPSRDTVCVLGDLVNRGPQSAATLRRLVALEGAAQCILGNHDLALLALAAGARRARPDDTAAAIVREPDGAALLQWLRQQPLARMAGGCLLVHAGVLPAWTVADTLALAGEVQAALRSEDHAGFLHAMYGNAPDAWDAALTGNDRLRVVVNALTRLRFCTSGGRMDFSSSEGADAPPPGCLPWFDLPGRRTAGMPIAFGHWSRLGLLQRDDLLGLDTGCVWGGALSACRWAPEPGDRHIVQVPCATESIAR